MDSNYPSTRLRTFDERKTWLAACRQGDKEMLDVHIAELRDDTKRNPYGIDFRDQNGYTALAVAANFNQLELVRHMLSLGASVNVVNHWKDTPLHRAAAQNFAEMAQLLLDHGADPTIENMKGVRAYEYARWAGHKEVMRIFREDKLAHPEKYKSPKLHELPRVQQPKEPAPISEDVIIPKAKTKNPAMYEDLMSKEDVEARLRELGWA